MSESKESSLEQRAMQGVSMTPEERKKMWLALSPDLSEAQFDALQAEQKARQVRVPQPGAIAPDFEADVLNSEHKRSGEKVRLSALRGKRIALIFGSYT